MNKAETMSAKHRVTGSTAILAAARCGWIVLRDPDSDDRKRRLFLPLKQNNSAGDDTGLAFRITADDPDGVAHIEWCDDPVEATADEVLRRAARSEARRDARRIRTVSTRSGSSKRSSRTDRSSRHRIEEEAKAAGTSFRLVPEAQRQARRSLSDEWADSDRRDGGNGASRSTSNDSEDDEL